MTSASIHTAVDNELLDASKRKLSGSIVVTLELKSGGVARMRIQTDRMIHEAPQPIGGTR